MSHDREIRKIIEPQLVMEGAGVLLRRSFAPQISNSYDPFLLFDHFAFNDPVEGAAVGFPMHPHRGIETVTYMLVGHVRHRDSLGNQGQIGPGDIQWMTAGSGILHEEMPQIDPERNISGFQLWVNLPAAEKMTTPHYQGFTATTIPAVKGKGWQVRLVAGELGEITGPVKGISGQPLYLDVCLEPGGEFIHPAPVGQTALTYVYEGEGRIGSQHISSVKMAVLGDGDTLRAYTQDRSMRFIFIAGTPIKEPIAPYGPFVMNTPKEIQEALADLRNGTFIKERSVPGTL